MGMTPAERSLRGRIAAYTLHSRYDSHEITERARKGFQSKFEREVDPDGVLPEAERLRRAEMARKAFYARLALSSAKARRKRAERGQNAGGRSLGRLPGTQAS